VIDYSSEEMAGCGIEPADGAPPVLAMRLPLCPIPAIRAFQEQQPAVPAGNMMPLWPPIIRRAAHFEPRDGPRILN